jgi:HTH-type transcriptional regulator / antitoxin HigA
MKTTEEKKLYPLGDTDYAVAPGETLRELLEEQGLSQRDLARRTGLSPKHVNRLLRGLVPLSADVAVRLERVTGTPAMFWNRLEANYLSDLERIRARRDLPTDTMRLRDLPITAGPLPAPWLLCRVLRSGGPVARGLSRGHGMQEILRD